MKDVKALSIDKHFLKRVEESNLPIITIHSVFSRTINLSIENQLYTIASNQLDNAPATMRIDICHFEDYQLQPNDRITVNDFNMNVANRLMIDLKTAIPWESKLPSYPQCATPLTENLTFAKAWIIAQGKAEWLRETNQHQTPFYQEMGRMLRERTTNLMNGFISADVTTNVERAMSLVGLGQGLTPSGDDFLVGVLLALATRNQHALPHNEWAEQVVRKAKEKTNVISYSALKYAAMGETRESINLLLQSLFAGNQEQVKRQLGEVMKIGSSSGTEITWGIINGLLLFEKIGGL